MELIDIDLIDECSWRCKEYDETTFLKLRAMIRQHGQCRSVTVCERPPELITGDLRRFILIEGRNIVQACKLEEHPVVWAHNVGVVTDVVAAEISLMLNELDFLTDYVEVAKLVNKIVDETTVNTAVSHSMFNQDQIVKFRKILKFDWEEFNNAKKSGKMSLFEENLKQGIADDILDTIKDIPDEERAIRDKVSAEVGE